MPGFDWVDESHLHSFPDRAIRKLLEDPENLRELISAVAPDLATGFDFSQVEFLPREFLLEDWRRRESDLLFRVPYRRGDEKRSTLVCLLIEHQSTPDPRMPLRILLYAVLYWEREWRAWEKSHPAGESLRRTPVLPIVFHTGKGRWTAHRELAELIDGPEELKRFAPSGPCSSGTWQSGRPRNCWKAPASGCKP